MFKTRNMHRNVQLSVIRERICSIYFNDMQKYVALKYGLEITEIIEKYFKDVDEG